MRPGRKAGDEQEGVRSRAPFRTCPRPHAARSCLRALIVSPLWDGARQMGVLLPSAA